MIRWISAEARRLKWTFIWSWRGFAAAWTSEKTLRQWSLANAISAGFAFWLPLSGAERAVILGLGLAILAAELLNTAIEVVVDYISTDQHPHAAKAKDCGSAAVAVTALAAGIAWVCVLYGRYWG